MIGNVLDKRHICLFAGTVDGHDRETYYNMPKPPGGLSNDCIVYCLVYRGIVIPKVNHGLFFLNKTDAHYKYWVKL